MSNKLYSLAQLDDFLADPDGYEIGGNLSLAKQLANTMREMETLRKLLDKAHIMINDWCVTYASEMCDKRDVEEAHERINNGGGILAYIADFNEEYENKGSSDVG